MPQYTYRCPLCQLTETRIVKIADRDQQTCDAPAERLKNVISRGLVTSAVVEVVVPGLCGAPLERDEMELTAATPYSWQP